MTDAIFFLNGFGNNMKKLYHLIVYNFVPVTKKKQYFKLFFKWPQYHIEQYNCTIQQNCEQVSIVFKNEDAFQLHVFHGILPHYNYVRLYSETFLIDKKPANGNSQQSVNIKFLPS